MHKNHTINRNLQPTQMSEIFSLEWLEICLRKNIDINVLGHIMFHISIKNLESNKQSIGHCRLIAFREIQYLKFQKFSK